MAFTVQDFTDLIRLLKEYPQWREELRRWVLTDELLSLPVVMRELAQRIEALAQQVAHLAQRVDALAATQAQMQDQIRALAEAQAQVQDQIRALAEAQGRTESEIRALAEAQRHTVDSLNELRGEVLEIRYRERAHAYFSKLIRRAHLLTPQEFHDLMDKAIAKGQLTEEEADDLVLADAIVRGIWREDKQEVYLVVEVSWVIGMDDVERARRRADILAKAGVRTVPVVAGKSISFDALQETKVAKVWQVRDGVAIPP